MNGDLATILIIEDDSAIRNGLADALTHQGYQAYAAADGISGLRMAVEVDCDLILLDLMLPGQSGLRILEEVRNLRPTLPVIILTALGQESDRIRGLNMGADDYVVKPFSIKELLARTEAVLRRSPERADKLQEIPIPDGLIDLARKEIRTTHHSPIPLSDREAELVRYLANNAGRVISRRELLTRIWRMDAKKIATRTIDMHVARLRDKIATACEHSSIITTVHGSGYMWHTPNCMEP